MSSLLITNVLVIDGQMEKAEPRDVLLKGNIIDTIAPAGSLGKAQQTLSGHGKKALMPGLVNAHTHAAMTLLRGLGEERPLMEWLKEKIWPIEARLKPSHIYWGTKLGILEMISRGVTCFGDMYFEMDQVARATLETGMRAGLSRGIIGDDRSKVLENLSLLKEYHDPDGLIHVQFGPHAPYTVPMKTLQNIADLALELDTGVHFHFLETEWEATYLTEEYSMTPLEFLKESRLYGVPQLILAHAVWFPEDQFTSISEENITLVHNIKSNLKLGSGIMPLSEMLRSGINIALGTDGAASNNELDLWSEMKTAALVHKGVFRDPTLVTARQVLLSGTLMGAKALGFENTGLIREGWKADLVLVDLDKPHYVGVNEENLACFLVYSGSAADVQSTIINGRVVYKGGDFLTSDEEEILSNAVSSRNELIS
ncbi:MAG: amidohydrolase [Synergistales bacterium]|nr:amidohydrolase [Synergistales bacterium]